MDSPPQELVLMVPSHPAGFCISASRNSAKWGPAAKWENPHSALVRSVPFFRFLKKKIRTVNCTRLFSVFKYQYFLLGVALHQLRWQEHPTSNGLLAAWPEHTLLVWFREGFLCLFLAWHPWNGEQRLPAALFIYFNELPLASSCLHHKDFRLPQSTRKHAANCYEAETWTCQISDPHESR